MPKTVFRENNLITTVKYGGGCVLVDGCDAAAEPGQLASGSSRSVKDWLKI